MANICKNICSSKYEHNFKSYEQGVKYCKLCTVFIKYEGVYCPLIFILPTWINNIMVLTYEERKARRKARHEKWRLGNKDKISEYNKRYREKYKDKEAARKKKYRAENTDKVSEYNKKYYAENKEYNQMRYKKWSKTPRGKELTHDRDTRRSHNIRAAGLFDLKAWKKKLSILGHMCQHCGTKEHICIDHIVPVSKGGSNHIDNLQPLCRSCNSSKKDKIEVNRY